MGILSLSGKEKFPSHGTNSRKYKSIFFRMKTFYFFSSTLNLMIGNSFKPQKLAHLPKVGGVSHNS